MNPQTVALAPRSGAILQRYTAAIAASNAKCQRAANNWELAVAISEGVISPLSRAELKSVNRGLGKATIRRVVLSGLFHVAGMPAVRAWRNLHTLAHRETTPFADLLLAARMFADGLQDAAWMTEDEAEGYLAACRPHSCGAALL